MSQAILQLIDIRDALLKLVFVKPDTMYTLVDRSLYAVQSNIEGIMNSAGGLVIKGFHSVPPGVAAVGAIVLALPVLTLALRLSGGVLGMSF